MSSAPTDQGHASQDRKSQKATELARAVESPHELLAPERHEHGDEDGREQRKDRVTDRTRRVRRRRRPRLLSQFEVGAGTSLLDADLAQPLPDRLRLGRSAWGIP